MASKTPPINLIRANDTHRLVPTRHEASVLAQIADSDPHLSDLFELDNATNDRLLAEDGKSLFPDIGIHELIFGVPYYRIVNAAFTHPHPLGSRFSGPDRGAWYAGFDIETAQAEVAYHKSLELAEIDYYEDDMTYRDYLADFTGGFHDLRDNRGYALYLHPDNYRDSQTLASQLFSGDSIGIVYPSVRRPTGTCLLCFRPAVVSNVREAKIYRFVWSGSPEPTISLT